MSDSETDRLNLDFFEKVIVYKSLTDEQYLSQIISFIKPEYFKNKDVHNVFRIIGSFFERRNSVPNITELKSLITETEDRKALKNVLVTCKELDKKYNYEELIYNTEKFIKEKAIYNTMMSVAEDVSNGKVDTSYILREFERSCNINLVNEIGLDYFNEIDKVIDHLLTDDPVIKTGWNWLDKRIDGGFLENGRSLYIFAGQTNIGKSIFLGNVSCNIASQGKTVLIISLEMPEMIYARRLSSNISKIPLSQLRTETNSLKYQIEDYQKENPDNRIIIKEFPPSTVTPQQIQGFIKSLKNKGIEIDAVVLDYLNLLKSPRGDNSYERVKTIAEEVRALSYVFNCPFISATQLNRGGIDDEKPGLDTISESYGLASTADCIFTLTQTEEDKELNIIKLGVLKNRFGAVGEYTSLRVNYNTLWVEEDESIKNYNNEEDKTGMNSLENLIGS